MTDALGAVFAVLLLVGFAWLTIRRRSNMTPEQRAIADLQRKVRRQGRELDRHRYE